MFEKKSSNISIRSLCFSTYIDLKKGFCELLKISELKETNVQVLNSENEKITKELNCLRSELNVRKIEILCVKIIKLIFYFLEKKRFDNHR